jgi:hypothetical protein
MPRGARTLFGKPLIEVVDLYKWGARVSDICMLYDLSPRTLKRVIRGYGVPMRPPHAPPIAQVKYEQRAESRIKSSRPQIPDGVQLVDASQGPDQLLRSSAHAQRDRRTAKRRLDANTGSCPAKASECRYAFLRSDNRLPDLE